MSTTTTTPARRSFLAALTAAIAAPAAATLPALPAKAEPMPEEAPELLVLGEKLAAAVDNYRTAKHNRTEAAARFASVCPPLPDDLICRSQMEVLSDLALAELDYLTCERVGSRHIYSATGVRIYILRHDVPRTTKEGRRLRRLARLATKFEREREAAYKTSGYGACESACDDAEAALGSACRSLCGAPLPLTSTGIAIIARAIMAVEEVDADHGNPVSAGLSRSLGRRLAEALLQPDGVST